MFEKSLLYILSIANVQLKENFVRKIVNVQTVKMFNFLIKQHKNNLIIIRKKSNNIETHKFDLKYNSQIHYSIIQFNFQKQTFINCFLTTEFC